VEDRLDLAIVAAREGRVELALVDVIGDTQIDQIAKLVALLQIIHGDDFVDAARVERLHQIAADEAGRAGNDDAHDA